MPKQLSATYNDQLRRIVGEYRDSGEEWPASARLIAAWAFRTGRWKPHRSSVVQQCARDLARAMREEYYIDPQGRHVRTKHVARITEGETQGLRWADIRTASSEHMERAFKLRREQIVGDCKQLKIDVDSFNDNNREGIDIQMTFNFERDLEELL